MARMGPADAGRRKFREIASAGDASLYDLNKAYWLGRFERGGNSWIQCDLPLDLVPVSILLPAQFSAQLTCLVSSDSRFLEGGLLLSPLGFPGHLAH